MSEEPCLPSDAPGRTTHRWRSGRAQLLAAGLAVTALLTSGSCREWKPEPGATPAEDIYRQNCVTCHGVNGAGADGPSIIDRRHSPEEVAAKVRAGGPGMPVYQGRLSDAEITEVAEYAASLSEPKT